MNLIANNVQVFILAGGLNSRMGSDKGMLMWNGETFIEHILKTLRSIFEHIVILSNNTLAYSNLGCNVIEDKIKDKGPIGGIYTGLHYAKKEMNLFVTCDAPLLSQSFYTFFLNSSYTSKINCSMIHNKIHPLPVLLSKDFLIHIEKNINNKIYKLWNIYQQHPCNAIEMNSYEKEMMNINTLEDYNRLISQK